MRVHIFNNKPLTTEIKFFHFQFDLPKYVDKNINHEVDFYLS